MRVNPTFLGCISTYKVGKIKNPGILLKEYFSPELAEKAKKMYETLQKFQAMKVRPFETEVERR